MEFKAIVKDPVGLHARPASVMVQEANKFESEITISSGDKSGNLKSIMSIMALGVKTQEEITISAEGADAEAALAAIKSALEASEVI